MPKVSVIIITYNRAALLPTAITSVLNQTFQDFEIIIVDDASQDETPSVVASFQDQRIRYIRHKQNAGEAGARNTGVANASGEYIAFLDDDDEWLPEKLELQLGVLKNNSAKVGVVYTGRLTIDGSSKKVISILTPTEKGDLLQELRRGSPITISSALVRKECFSEIGLFDEQIAYGVDYDMWIRIAGTYHFECVAKPLVKYTVHRRSLSADLDRAIKGNEAVLKKHEAYFVQNGQDYSRFCAQLGIRYYLNKNARKGRQMFLRAVRSYPFPTRYYLTWIGLSLLGVEGYKRVQKVKRLLSSPFSAEIQIT
jgi:glycosyltransferase involved in cell wall biosynthesis